MSVIALVTIRAGRTSAVARVVETRNQNPTSVIAMTRAGPTEIGIREATVRETATRDVFMRGLNLPRGREREMVHDPRERAYSLRGSETRTLTLPGSAR